MPELTEISEDVRIYEFCVLYPSNLSQKEESTLLKDVETLIEEQGGKQVSKDMWGKRGLAYRIKGNDEGNYVVYHYELDPSKIQELDESLRITKNVLRHMIVKPPKGYEITKFSASYETWLKERETEEDRRKKEKEARLAKQVADKAKRQVKKAAKVASEEKEEKPEADKKKISEELDKLISDDDLDI
ncbi:MAG: 30S ribosomal protein S6 [Candidatus Peregrinibacteria bacterium]|nr:30S ribosomal protein S6 [Candidatus Peregrinibacteria bacterium]MCB9808036.1 30S ribosomal protein S6 [Candidatus Peribacteria bacterium]